MPHSLQYQYHILQSSIHTCIESEVQVFIKNCRDNIIRCSTIDQLHEYSRVEYLYRLWSIRTPAYSPAPPPSSTKTDLTCRTYDYNVQYNRSLYSCIVLVILVPEDVRYCNPCKSYEYYCTGTLYTKSNQSQHDRDPPNGRKIFHRFATFARHGPDSTPEHGMHMMKYRTRR